MSIEQPYRDRIDAGQILAAHVRDELGTSVDAVVLALPRGGVPVGLEIARALHAPLDVFIVRKLGAPGFEEFAIGAIAAGGFEVLNEQAIADLGVSRPEVDAILERETEELRRREEAYRGSYELVTLAGRVVILVDDGLATGFTMRAAIAAARARGPQRLMVAVPVGAAETCADIAREVDTLICPLQPDPFQAVGLWYRDFTPTTDEEVRDCLAASSMHDAARHLRRRG